MCRMIGFSFRQDKNTNWLFKSLQDMAANGIHSPHTDGWGEYLMNSSREILYHKSVNKVFNDTSPDFDALLGIMHARKASPGLDVSILQLHPYMINGDIFAHNGTIRKVNIENPFKTDSFELFKRIRNFNFFEQLERNVKNFIMNSDDFTAINFLMIKGEDLYVLQLFNEEEEYYTMWYSKNADGFVTASEKINEDFIPFENGDLMKINRGEILRKVNLLR